jgi:hypothetical protein
VPFRDEIGEDRLLDDRRMTIDDEPSGHVGQSAEGCE